MSETIFNPKRRRFTLRNVFQPKAWLLTLILIGLGFLLGVIYTERVYLTYFLCSGQSSGQHVELRK